MMKDIVKYNNIFSNDYGINHNHHIHSLSTSNDASLNKNRK